MGGQLGGSFSDVKQSMDPVMARPVTAKIAGHDKISYLLSLDTGEKQRTARSARQWCAARRREVEARCIHYGVARSLVPPTCLAVLHGSLPPPNGGQVVGPLCSCRRLHDGAAILRVLRVASGKDSLRGGMRCHLRRQIKTYRTRRITKHVFERRVRVHRVWSPWYGAGLTGLWAAF